LKLTIFNRPGRDKSDVVSFLSKAKDLPELEALSSNGRVEIEVDDDDASDLISIFESAGFGYESEEDDGKTPLFETPRLSNSFFKTPRMRG
jgi:hypothetical protein